MVVFSTQCFVSCLIWSDSHHAHGFVFDTIPCFLLIWSYSRHADGCVFDTMPCFLVNLVVQPPRTWLCFRHDSLCFGQFGFITATHMVSFDTIPCFLFNFAAQPSHKWLCFQHNFWFLAQLHFTNATPMVFVSIQFLVC